MQGGEIEIAPLAFMRGRTLANAVVILDEAQNTTSMQMKMFLTRLGENSRMIVTGDPSQVDLPYGQVSGLAEATRLLANVEGIAQVTFTAQDVVRHELVGRIVEAYDKAALASARDAQAVTDPAEDTVCVEADGLALEIGVAPGAAALDAKLPQRHRVGDRRRQPGRRAGARRGHRGGGRRRAHPRAQQALARASTSRPTCCRSPPRIPSRGPARTLGDIAISYETAAREAAAEDKSFADHIAHLSVHGFLHLLGYDHESDDDAEEMEGLERAILARIGVSDPYVAHEAEG